MLRFHGGWRVVRGKRALGIAVATSDELMAVCLRGRPRMLLVDARHDDTIAAEACGRVKVDSYSAVTPTIAFSGTRSAARWNVFFAAGADEVLTDATPAVEVRARLNAALARSDRTFMFTLPRGSREPISSRPASPENWPKTSPSRCPTRTWITSRSSTTDTATTKATG